MCAYVDIYFLNRPILRRSCLRLHSGCRCPYISRCYFPNTNVAKTNKNNFITPLFPPTMPENLQTRLHNSLDEILKSSGYIFEIIDQNRKQSNVITSPNNELIQKSITQLLNGEIQNFHAILDQTVSKLNDAEWCLGVMVEKKKKLDELKVKEEAARKKREEEAKKKAEQAKKAEEAKKCFILLFCQICTTFNLCANILFYLIFIYFYFTILFYRTFYIFSLSTHLLYNIFLRL